MGVQGRWGFEVALVRGYTLIELVLVLLLVSALAVFVTPRWTGLAEWRLQAYGDALRSEWQARHRQALVQRRVIKASISPAGLQFLDASDALLVARNCPVALGNCIAEASTRTVVFNGSASGAVQTPSNLPLTLTLSSGGASRVFQVEADTGLLRAL